MSLSRFAVSAPVKVTMIFTAVLLLGIISLQRLPTNLFPDIRAPKVTTTIRTTGLSPVEVERRIVEPLERQMFTLRGVRDVTTISRADTAVVITEFTWDTPLDFAFLDVKKAVADIQRERSTEIESATVLRYDPNAAPVMTVALTWGGNVNAVDIRRLAEQTLRPRFERLEGVANVVIAGGAEQEVRIALNEPLLLLHNIDVSTVVSAMERENVNATGGTISEGARQYLLKSIGEFEGLEDIADVVVKREGDSVLLLSDVAEVTWAEKEPDDLVMMNGEPALGLSFYRSAESNTVAVAEAIRDELQALSTGDARTLLPPDTKMVVTSDQSEFIRAAIREVRNNALVGGLLAVVVLLLFLRDTRTTLIIALSIPISIIATFNLMYFQGLTLNLMSLGGLALGSGMLVDNAIVVLENIFRHRQQGEDAKTAAREGTRGVAAAIIASTLTTIVVFLPVVYVRGVAGLLFREQALTVAYSLLASLMVALLLIPMLASKFLTRPVRTLADTESASGNEVPRTLYARMLSGALRVRWLIIAASVFLLFISVQALRAVPQEFLPPTDRRQVEIRVVLPTGTPLESTARVAETLAERAQTLSDEVSITFVRAGESEGQVNADTEDPDGPNTADLRIVIGEAESFEPEPLNIARLAQQETEEGEAEPEAPQPERPRRSRAPAFTSAELVADLKPAIEDLPDVKAQFVTQQGSLTELIGTTQAPLLIEISGDELPVLQALSEEARGRLETIPGLLNVRTNILQGAPEVRIRLDRVQLARLGLDVQSVADTLRRRIEGQDAGRIRREAGDIDIRVEVEYARETIEMLGDIVLQSADGAKVPLRTIADFEIERGPREIVRRGQERTARVMADLESGVRLSAAIGAARDALSTLRVPPGYALAYTGEELQRQEAFDNLRFALLLSILLVYMVMASIFESFLQPFLIMFTLPLAAVGVAAAFLLTNQTINVMGIIGVVFLAGIVVNNAIVLLDCVNRVRKDSALGDRETLIIGCNRRLRPVLMTSLTTMLALLPLALGIGEGAELRQAMAVAVLGGLFSATLLTLFVIPICQSYLDSARGAVRRILRRREERLAARAPRGAQAGK